MVIRNIFSVLLGFLTACVIFFFIVQNSTNTLCLTNSNACINITFYNYGNSVLCYFDNSPIKLFYDGENFFVFELTIGRICSSDYSPAYKISGKTGIREGYYCVKKFTDIQQFYDNNGVSPKTLTKHVGSGNFDIYSVINLLLSENIIFLPTN